MFGVNCPNCGSDDISEGFNFDWDENGHVVTPEDQPLLVPSCNACGTKIEVIRHDPNTEVRTLRSNEKE